MEPPVNVKTKIKVLIVVTQRKKKKSPGRHLSGDRVTYVGSQSPLKWRLASPLRWSVLIHSNPYLGSFSHFLLPVFGHVRGLYAGWGAILLCFRR